MAKTKVDAKKVDAKKIDDKKVDKKKADDKKDDKKKVDDKKDDKKKVDDKKDDKKKVDDKKDDKKKVDDKKDDKKKADEKKDDKKKIDDKKDDKKKVDDKKDDKKKVTTAGGGDQPASVKDCIKVLESIKDEKSENTSKAPGALDKLYRLALDGKGKDVATALAPLQTVMQALTKNAEVQYRSCGVIWALACEGGLPKESGKKLIPLIEKALTQHPKEDLLLQQAVGALGNLAVNNNDNKALIASATVWKILLQQGTSKGGDKTSTPPKPDISASIVESCLAVLKILANSTKAPPNKAVVPLAEAGTLIKIMETHAANANLQGNAYGLIQNLGPTYATKLVGATKPILQAMSKNGKDVVLIRNALGALAVLATGVFEAEGADRKVFNDCPGPILKCMGEHKADADIQEQGCGAILSLTGHHEANQNAVAKDQGIKLIVMAIGEHKQAIGVQRNACGALVNLSTGNEKNKAAIAAAGGIVAVVTAMKAHIKDIGVQKEGCGVLNNLCRSTEEIRLKVEKAEAKKVLDAAAKIKDAEVIARANAALEALKGGGKEGKAGAKADPKAGGKVDPKAVDKVDPKAVIKVDPKAVVKADPKAVVKVDPKAVIKVDPKAVIKVDPKAVVKADPKVDPKAVIKVDPKAGAKVDPKASDGWTGVKEKKKKAKA